MTNTAQNFAALGEHFAAVVGPKNQNYYLSRFAKFAQEGKTSIGWHWPALLMTFFWLLYRKMWLPAVIWWTLPYLILAALGGLGTISESALAVGTVVYSIALFLVPALYADALYFKHCQRKIAQIQALAKNEERQLGELSAVGGTSNVAIVIIALIALAIVAIFAAIAIPAYHDYSTRAQIAEGLITGQQAGRAAERYRDRTGRFPDSLAAASFSADLPDSVESLRINSETGAVTIVLAVNRASGKEIRLTPEDTDDGIYWNCSSQQVPERLLPYRCRPIP